MSPTSPSAEGEATDGLSTELRDRFRDKIRKHFPAEADLEKLVDSVSQMAHVWLWCVCVYIFVCRTAKRAVLQSAAVTINLHLNWIAQGLCDYECSSCMKWHVNWFISSNCLCVCRLWVFIRTESSSLFSMRNRRVLMILIQFSWRPLLEVSTFNYTAPLVVENYKITQ